MRKVLVIRFSALGDILLTLPAVQDLKKSNATVEFLSKHKFVPLLQMAESINVVHSISDHASLGELIQKIKELGQNQYDEVIDLHNNLRSRIACHFLKKNDPKITVRRVSKFRIKEILLYVFKRISFHALNLREINRPLANLELVSKNTSQSAWKSQTLGKTGLAKNLESVIGELKEKKYVCFSSESVWQSKEWKFENFLEVAKHFAMSGYEVVWLGVKSELAEKVEGMIDLRGKTSLPEAASVLKNAKFLVCNDSGLMHLAEAVGTPVFAVFGPTSRELGFAPRLSESKIIESDLWCRPCSKTGRACHRIFEKRKCLNMVSASDVLNTIAATGINR